MTVLLRSSASQTLPIRSSFASKCPASKTCRFDTVQPKEEMAQRYRRVRLPQELDKFGGINWAGQRHARLNFHKHKDPINEWTEVLFRS